MPVYCIPNVGLRFKIVNCMMLLAAVLFSGTNFNQGRLCSVPSTVTVFISTVGSGGFSYTQVVRKGGDVLSIVTVRFISPAASLGSFGAITVKIYVPVALTLRSTISQL